MELSFVEDPFVLRYVQGEEGGWYVVKVSREDEHLLDKHGWLVSGQGYVRRAINARGGRGCVFVYLHREILKSSSRYQVDHLDHDRLNNQRSNLRRVDRRTNYQNRRPKGEGAFVLEERMVELPLPTRFVEPPTNTYFPVLE